MPLPRPRRLRTRFLILTPLLIILYFVHLRRGNSSSSPPPSSSSDNDRIATIMSVLTRMQNLKKTPQQAPKPVVHETQETPEFQYYSPFRDNPDTEFEETLEFELREIEERERLESKYKRREKERDAGRGEGEEEEEEWPKKIWQVWLSKGWRPGDPDGEGFGEGVKKKEGKEGEEKEDQKVVFMKAWKDMNPDYEHTLLTDLTADKFVSTFYSSVPSLVHLYRTLPVPVMKADLLRYLLLYAHGGVWLDHDVYPVKPLSTCPFPIHLPQPQSSISPYTSLLVGVEIDEPYVTSKTRTQWHWSRIYGFIQYHMVAKPFSPFVRKAIVRVVAHAYAHAKKRNSGLSRVWAWWNVDGGVWTGGYSEVEVLEITGPGVWTDAILDTLTEGINMAPTTPQAQPGPGNEDVSTLPLDLLDPDPATGKKRVTWRPFTGIKKPKQITIAGPGHHSSSSNDKARLVQTDHDQALGIYILPINIWGNGQRHSGAQNFKAKQACVNHLFLRSWKRGWWEWAFG